MIPEELGQIMFEEYCKVTDGVFVWDMDDAYRVTDWDELDDIDKKGWAAVHKKCMEEATAYAHETFEELKNDLMREVERRRHDKEKRNQIARVDRRLRP